MRAALRFDGLWWRKLAWLGCVYGPEWWRRGSPPVIAFIIFLLVGPESAGRDRESGASARGRVGDGARAQRLRMFATFARCFTETTEFYGPRPRRVRIDEPERNYVAEALERGRG